MTSAFSYATVRWGRPRPHPPPPYWSPFSLQSIDGHRASRAKNYKNIYLKKIIRLSLRRVGVYIMENEHLEF